MENKEVKNEVETTKTEEPITSELKVSDEIINVAENDTTDEATNIPDEATNLPDESPNIAVESLEINQLNLIVEKLDSLTTSLATIGENQKVLLEAINILSSKQVDNKVNKLSYEQILQSIN